MRLLNSAFAGILSMTFPAASFTFRGCCRVSCNHRTTAPRLSNPILFSLTRGARCIDKFHRREPYSSTTNLFASNTYRNNENAKTRTSSSESSKNYRLDGRGLVGGTKIEATTNTGHTLSTDIPRSMGGGDTAAQPVETLLAAWMGCTQATASFVGRQLLMERRTSKEDRPARVQILLEFVNIQAVRDERGALQLPIRETPTVPSRLQRITGTIKVSMVPASRTNESATTNLILKPEELEVLREQTEARCPIANMIVESGCAMDVEWIQDSSNL